MEEDDLLDHWSEQRGSLVYKLAFERGVHAVDKERGLYIKGFSKEVFSMAPKNGHFRFSKYN